jgi:hypothetical protein
MKMLVTGSCTGSKDDARCPPSVKLTEADFNDVVRLCSREKELSNWLRPAAEMYTGRQHTQMMDGVQLMRSAFGQNACDVAIVSAGYGLVPERRPIAPYDITFQGIHKPLIKARGQRLGIPDAIGKLIANYPVVLFLLGDDYLRSAHPPLIPSGRQKFIYFGSPKLRYVDSADVVIVAAAQEAATEFGGSRMFVKGRMFHLLAAGVQQQPKMWAEVVRDRTPQTVVSLIRDGKQHV